MTGGWYLLMLWNLIFKLVVARTPDEMKIKIPTLILTLILTLTITLMGLA